MQSLPSGFTVFFHRAPLHFIAPGRLKIYASTEPATHFVARCIKPVTGLIVSRCLLPLWTRPFHHWKLDVSYLLVAYCGPELQGWLQTRSQAAVYYAHRPTLASENHAIRAHCRSLPRAVAQARQSPFFPAQTAGGIASFTRRH